MWAILSISNVTPISIAHWARSDAISREPKDSEGRLVNVLVRDDLPQDIFEHSR